MRKLKFWATEELLFAWNYMQESYLVTLSNSWRIAPYA